MLGSPYPPAISVSNPQGKWALINVRVQLSNVADLTRPSQRKLIGTNVQELTGDWRGYLLRDAQSNLKAGAPFLTMVPTQRLGHELESVPRLEGFLSYSAKVPTKKNLIVFPKKLQANSFIKFENPITGQTQRIP
ncbi:MAG: hypothetical protein ABS79_00890 [Planctomycetes bacterium SCN 63-9]|nr:MAG: hypothetical protein ABS79_00890 [Planctomycetes bacterium SCN 63-9]